MNRRVVLTGIGIVSPLGLTREETWRRVLAGESGARYITRFDATTWPVKFMCEVDNFKLSEGAADQTWARFLNRPSSFGLEAALEAMNDSGVAKSLDHDRFGVSVGASIGGISPLTLGRLLQDSEIPAEAHALLRNHPGTLAALLAARWNARGPMTTIHTACASSGQSLGQAFLQIRRGEADVMIAGGADSLSGEFLLAGFCLLGALSTRNDDPQSASRPFDKDRDGFVASEGAAMVILEEYEHARARGAKIYAEFGGYGETEAAYRITDMPEDGRGIVEAMVYAVQDAGMAFSDVHYINAHGTSTQLNDRVEAFGVRKVFGGRGFHPMVSSTKSEVGHLISAAGAMEAAFCALAIARGQVPPTRNLIQSDCGDDVDLVAQIARESKVYAALSNSIGFGGSNSVVLLRKAG